MNIAIGFIIGVICYWLVRIPAQSILNHNKNRKIKVPSHPKPLPKLEEQDDNPVVIKVILETGGFAFREESKPVATIYRKSRLIEVATMNESMVFSFDNIECLDYRVNARIYWED
ncbi:hypothetical protein [Companilactobacillus nantensis]|uniref:Uncharacterized protein n=1 Tax=Companilactobacillus nantensis DSM 16982 TaxID=1423774 RepID=A0A0R1WDI2_9LACO|nr:hypothetical protein [Companilactobacillus nantensis]KRM15927.1 hypothetical protein FD31_GL000822 [Companilactobacillus nantensis DSM 16982]GEO64790.1 hypothetical protein LNA01_19730 [Companilactobacillus nantensis]